MIECFVRSARIQPIGPCPDCANDFVGVAATEFQACSVASAVFLRIERAANFDNRFALELDGLQWRSTLCGDSVDATVSVVTVRITHIVLHVTDQNI